MQKSPFVSEFCSNAHTTTLAFIVVCSIYVQQVFLLAVFMPHTLEGALIAYLWRVLGWTGNGTMLLL